MDLTGAGAARPRVERLPEDLVNKIAAGEVVERPASVVKELLENALDAGASTVTVEIEGGGKSLIRVRDDGVGMEREDARLALERHATSKLRTLGDLETVATHGFRGEALPSIASVAHLVLRTRDAASAAGTEAEVRHGRLVHVRDAGHPRGTTVEVRDLFGAVPARRKFLRAETTEAAHVSEAVTLLALARPDVGFRLLSAGRTLIEAPATDGLRARAFQLFGDTFLREVVAVEGGQDWVNVDGLACRPESASAARGVLRLFVNGRAVRDRAVARAVTEAYRAAGVRDNRGDVILFLGVPQHLVDVNVHPAKTEVRFADARMVWSGVGRALRSAFARAPAAAGGPRAPVPAAGASVTEEAPAAPSETSGWRWSFVAEPPAEYGPRPVSAAAGLLFGPAPPTVLGQHRNTYIVATDGEDLVLVDQHTAHERVRFEALVGGLDRGRPGSQMLLAPIVMPLSPRLRPLLEAHQDTLAGLGFDVEPFGGDAVRMRAVPEALGARDPGRALDRLLAELLERDDAEWEVAAGRDRVAAVLACHSAARAGEPLGPDAQRAIVAGLWSAKEPAVCPHGRPTRVRVPRDDVARWFRRTGWRRE
jgi:DNA mismatch repair protein MutL